MFFLVNLVTGAFLQLEVKLKSIKQLEKGHRNLSPIFPHFSKTTYHVEALELASNFLSVINNEVPSVMLHIDSRTAKRIKQN